MISNFGRWFNQQPDPHLALTGEDESSEKHGITAVAPSGGGVLEDLMDGSMGGEG